ncbi:ABC transporter permease [Candidatus Peregrinibacteria bacterium]|nr:MAG: ABC transporter permease [Candidatus Peregrinibacteria bacterium]
MPATLIRLWALTEKECRRFLRVWLQTVMSPVITAILYFAVFGAALSPHISGFSKVSYLAFIVPGLILLQATNNAFQNPSSSLIIAKYHGNIVDLLTAPLSALEKTLGYLFGGIIRGMMVSLVIWAVAAFFVPHLFPEHPLLLLLMLFLANGVFTLLGTIVGIWGNTFDQISGFTTFIITPMGFLGGIFYSIELLPPLARTLSLGNPFFYFADGARWAFFGIADVSPIASFSVCGGMFLVLFTINWFMFAKDWRLKE